LNVPAISFGVHHAHLPVPRIRGHRPMQLHNRAAYRCLHLSLLFVSCCIMPAVAYLLQVQSEHTSRSSFTHPFIHVFDEFCLQVASGSGRARTGLTTRIRTTPHGRGGPAMPSCYAHCVVAAAAGGIGQWEGAHRILPPLHSRANHCCCFLLQAASGIRPCANVLDSSLLKLYLSLLFSH
jgi:hypothetical protein